MQPHAHSSSYEPISNPTPTSSPLSSLNGLWSAELQQLVDACLLSVSSAQHPQQQPRVVDEETPTTSLTALYDRTESLSVRKRKDRQEESRSVEHVKRRREEENSFSVLQLKYAWDIEKKYRVDEARHIDASAMVSANHHHHNQEHRIGEALERSRSRRTPSTIVYPQERPTTSATAQTMTDASADRMDDENAIQVNPYVRRDMDNQSLVTSDTGVQEKIVSSSSDGGSIQIRESPELLRLLLTQWGWDVSEVIRTQHLKSYSEPYQLMNSQLIPLSNAIMSSLQRFGVSSIVENGTGQESYPCTHRPTVETWTQGVDQTTQSVLRILNTATRLSSNVRYENDTISITTISSSSPSSSAGPASSLSAPAELSSPSSPSKNRVLKGWTNPRFVKWLLDLSTDQLSSLRPSIVLSPQKQKEVAPYTTLSGQEGWQIDTEIIFILGMKMICIDLLLESWARIRQTLTALGIASVSNLQQELTALSLPCPTLVLTPTSFSSCPLPPITTISQCLTAVQSPQIFSEAEHLLASLILPRDLYVLVTPVLRRLRLATHGAMATDSHDLPLEPVVTRSKSYSLHHSNTDGEHHHTPRETRTIKTDAGITTAQASTSNGVKNDEPNSNKSLLLARRPSSSSFSSFSYHDSDGEDYENRSDAGRCEEEDSEREDDDRESWAFGQRRFQDPLNNLRSKRGRPKKSGEDSKRKHDEIVKKYCTGMTDDAVCKSLTSDVKNVYFNKSTEVWQCYYQSNGKRKNKTFPIRTFGFEEAKRRAEHFQKNQKRDCDSIDTSTAQHQTHSAMKGVSYQPSKRSWVASFYEHGKRRYLSYSIDDFGSARAERLAIKTRKEAEATGKLPNRYCVLASDAEDINNKIHPEELSGPPSSCGKQESDPCL